MAGEGGVVGHEADVEAWDCGDGVEEGVIGRVTTVDMAETGCVCGLIGWRDRQSTSRGFQSCNCKRGIPGIDEGDLVHLGEPVLAAPFHHTDHEEGR